ncbi:protein of unknown function [Candidatus Promineifilum breve]|uniref:Uncharacterized protein n=1 Tax=Candidatus Promineifilum breve TaxID=1806508 RepID=A0A161KD88_9CHLR|nr:hypothetical protein [Candidatus Promineifilum breve]CUS06273.1 protein of unknown function [Candidatus Promineifilum breve]
MWPDARPAACSIPWGARPRAPHAGMKRRGAGERGGRGAGERGGRGAGERGSGGAGERLVG